MIKIPLCIMCENFISKNKRREPEKPGNFCKAFPDGDGIPDIFGMPAEGECANGYCYKHKEHPKENK